jgi:signal peptidase I
MQAGVALDNRVATFEVQSDAMEPTIKKGSKLAVERFYYSSNRLQRWHIVLVLLSHTETDKIPSKLIHQEKGGKQREFARPHFPYIKRVVGLPGETLKFTDKEMLIDGRSLPIPDDLARCYAGFPGSKTFQFAATNYRVPDDEIFVLSDNVKQGVDSRHIGAVPLRCVLGRCAL